MALLLVACAGQPGPYRPDADNTLSLTPCPPSPNCASTEHSIGRPVLALTPEQAWRAIIAIVSKLPRTTISYQDGYYLRAESRSFVFRFTDDVEIYLDAANNQLVMRSASRLGYSDLGVNARRLKKLIAQFKAQGIVK